MEIFRDIVYIDLDFSYNIPSPIPIFNLQKHLRTNEIAIPLASSYGFKFEGLKNLRGFSSKKFGALFNVSGID